MFVALFSIISSFAFSPQDTGLTYEANIYGMSKYNLWYGGSQAPRPFVKRGTGPRIEPRTPTGQRCVGRVLDVNSFGVAVGHCEEQAFVWDATRSTKVTYLGLSRPSAMKINDNGDVAITLASDGSARWLERTTIGYQTRDIGTAVVTATNNADDIAIAAGGWADVLYMDGGLPNMTGLNRISSLSDYGEFAGEYGSRPYYVDADDQYVDILSTPSLRGYTTGQMFDINNHFTSIGQVAAPNGAVAGLMYDGRKGTAQILTNGGVGLLTGPSNPVIPYHIDDNGNILASAFVSGQWKWFLLTNP